MKSPRTWVKKIVCALSVFAVGSNDGDTSNLCARRKAKRKQPRFKMYTSQSSERVKKILMQNNQEVVRGIAHE